MTETNQPQTWHAMPWNSGICRCTDGTHSKIDDVVASKVRLRDEVLADHAAATKLADAEAEIERLKKSDEHHNQLATEYFKNWQDALADRDALRKDQRELRDLDFKGNGHVHIP